MHEPFDEEQVDLIVNKESDSKIWFKINAQKKYLIELILNKIW